MARQPINLGTAPTGEDGDNARQAFERVNQMTAELYGRVDVMESGKVSTSDPRLSDSREWTAATVPQAEAEDGTGTTRRAWTAQRVWQAVAAWWAASPMKTKLDGIAANATANATDAQLRDRATHTGTQTANTISNFGAAAIGSALAGFTVAASRNAVTAADTILGGFQKVQKYLNDLGTAAYSNLTSTSIDTAAGRVLKTGDGGWMGDVPVNTSVTNLDDRTIRGFRYYDNNVQGVQPEGVTYGIFNTFGIGGNFICQEFWEISTGSAIGRKWRRNCFISGAWSKWVRYTDSDSVKSLPAINLLPDSGRFAGKINPMQITVTGNTFGVPAFFAAFNGATHNLSGQFIYDNSTSGGGGAALTEPVTSLLAAMGRTGANARYGIEFYVDTLVFGSGTVGPIAGADSVLRYLATTNGSRPIFQVDNYATIVMWMRARSSSFHIATSYFKNGVRVPAGTPIAVAEGWVHIRVAIQNLMGFDNAFPYIYGVPGGSVNIALPAVFNGLADVGIHTNPISTLNELSA